MNFAARKSAGQPKQDQSQRHYTANGWITPSIVALLCLCLVGAAIERGRGNFQKLRTRVDPPPPTEAVPEGPGGQEAIRLTRSATNVGQGAEFLSATLLPGRGMNVFQITALIPGHGEVPLLVSPPLAEAASVLSGTHEDASGIASTSLGGAFLVPWAATLSGTLTTNPGVLQTDWEGKHLTFPASTRPTTSVEGLLLNRGADTIKSDVLADGQSALATFNVGDFSGSWTSSVEVTVLAELTARALDLTMIARNVGTTPVPFGMGWHPVLSIPSGNRANALLVIPSQSVVDVDHRTGLPTGKFVQVDDSPRDLSHVRGTRLGTTAINETYTSLQPGPGSGPVAELTDPAYNLKIRIIPLTSNINNFRVIAPADKPWISIGPNTNLDDPFGPQWGQPENAGMTLLAPGASVRWKVRVEIALVGASEAAQ